MSKIIASEAEINEDPAKKSRKCYTIEKETLFWKRNIYWKRNTFLKKKHFFEEETSIEKETFGFWPKKTDQIL